MNLEELKNSGLIIFEGIVGSTAYGTNTPESDIDIKGIYIQHMDSILGYGYTPQISDEKNDTTYYEVGRFLELLAINNPNILELLNLPENMILFKHPLFTEILKYKDIFLTKACKNSFAGYAVSQIKKARGLNKKIVNPIDKEKKSPLDFCYVIGGNLTKNGSLPLIDWLDKNDMVQEKCGLTNIPNALGVYSLFYHYNNKYNYKGVVKKIDGKLVSNEIRLSSIPKKQYPACFVSYNKDGYTKYCKDYTSYWKWVNERNESRYNDNVENGQGYDGKNMAHCIRLIDMAMEIGQDKGINVKRSDREKLLSIRKGEYSYDELVKESEDKIKQLDKIYDESNLPEKIDGKIVDNLLTEIRKSFINNYNENSQYKNKLKQK